MNHKYKLIIFDWDGTLCDSVTTISTCIQYAAKQQGLAVPSFAEASNIIGLGLKEAVSFLFPNADDQVVAGFLLQELLNLWQIIFLFTGIFLICGLLY